MTALSSATAQSGSFAQRWRRATAAWRLVDDWGEAKWAWRRIALHLSLAAAVLALCMVWGLAVALAEYNALILCFALTACIFILIDFRVGVILLITLMPISASSVFPHAMAGITGLNPLNLLLAATLGSYFLQRLSEEGRKRVVPKRLLWAYVGPIAVAGLIGAFHVGEIAPYFHMNDLIEFSSAGGYLRDLLLKPLFWVLFALLTGTAVARSKRPEWFFIPALVSIWLMGLLAVVYFLLSGYSVSMLAGAGAREFLSPLGMHANDLGRLYAIAYALLLFTCAETRDAFLRSVLVASMAVVAIALVLTFSRGALFGFVVVNVLFLLSRRRPATWIAGCAVAVAGLWLLPDAVYERMTLGFDTDLNAVSAGRLETIWLPLLPELARSPIIGNGLSSILWSDAMNMGTMLQVDHPHNAYLRAVLDMGIVGLSLLLACFLYVWGEFRRLGRDTALDPAQRGFYAGAAAGLASFLIAGIAGSSLTPVPEQSFLWLAVGMMYGQRAGRVMK
jgi:hypothetical protein